MHRYLRALLGLWVMCSPLWAGAEAVSVAVLGLESVEGTDDLAQHVTETLRQRVAGTSGLRSVQGKDLVELKMVFNCDGESPACLAQVGRSLGAEKLLYGSLATRGKSNMIAVSLKFLDVRSGAIERTINESLPRRELSAENLTQTVSRWLGALLPSEAKPILHVTSEPSGAKVSVAGRQLGRTPLTIRDLGVGSYDITFSLRGYRTTSRALHLRAGGVHDVTVALDIDVVTGVVAAPPRTTEVTTVKAVGANDRYRSGNAMRISGGVLLGLGVVAGVSAIVLYTQYSGLETTLNGTLTNMRDQSTIVSGSPQATWFSAPDCAPPTGIGNLATRDAYVSDCQRGESMAIATTAMVVTGAVLGVAGITLVGVGQARVSSSRSRLALRTVEPWTSTTGAGITTAFRF